MATKDTRIGVRHKAREAPAKVMQMPSVKAARHKAVAAIADAVGDTSMAAFKALGDQKELRDKKKAKAEQEARVRPAYSRLWKRFVEERRREDHVGKELLKEENNFHNVQARLRDDPTTREAFNRKYGVDVTPEDIQKMATWTSAYEDLPDYQKGEAEAQTKIFFDLNPMYTHSPDGDIVFNEGIEEKFDRKVGFDNISRLVGPEEVEKYVREQGVKQLETAGVAAIEASESPRNKTTYTRMVRSLGILKRQGKLNEYQERNMRAKFRKAWQEKVNRDHGHDNVVREQTVLRETGRQRRGIDGEEQWAMQNMDNTMRQMEQRVRDGSMSMKQLSRLLNRRPVYKSATVNRRQAEMAMTLRNDITAGILGSDTEYPPVLGGTVPSMTRHQWPNDDWSSDFVSDMHQEMAAQVPGFGNLPAGERAARVKALLRKEFANATEAGTGSWLRNSSVLFREAGVNPANVAKGIATGDTKLLEKARKAVAESDAYKAYRNKDSGADTMPPEQGPNEGLIERGLNALGALRNLIGL